MKGASELGQDVISFAADKYRGALRAFRSPLLLDPLSGSHIPLGCSSPKRYALHRSPDEGGKFIAFVSATAWSISH